MIEIDWLQFSVAATILMVSVGGGVWVGFLGGKQGHGRFRTMGRAVGRSALLIFAGTTILAGVLAHHELGEEAREIGNYVEFKDLDGFHGLKLDHEEWWAAQVRRHNVTHWCNCPRCEPEDDYNPTNVVNRAMGRATIWAFLAPVFCLAGAIPAMVSAAFAFNFGVRARIVERWQREHAVLSQAPVMGRR